MPNSFREKYGDYYLGALILGADTSTFLSTSSSHDLNTEIKDIKVKAKALFVTKTVVDEHTKSEYQGNDFDLNFLGFDTLSGGELKSKLATDRESYDNMWKEVVPNVKDGMHLNERVKEVLQKLELGGDDTIKLTAEKCKAIVEEGLVVELLFLPYAGLRDYVVATYKPTYKPPTL